MKQLTVTIAIPTYNEEKNIYTLLSAILLQDQKNFVLEKILVIDDGSTDQTVKQLQRLTDQKIVIKKRFGEKR